MSAISMWYKGTSNAFKAAINTAWQSFVGVFGLALLGFLGDVAKWTDGSVETFPSVSVLGKAAIAAAASAASFLVTYAIRGYQKSKDASKGPSYE